MIPQCRLLLMVIFLVIISILLSLSKGSTSIPIYQLLFSENNQFQLILLKLRLPRTLAAFTCGGLLGLAGVLIQLLLQNPLADPYVLGISSGAALVTLLMMLIGMSEPWLMTGAWLGSGATMLLMVFLARKHCWQTHTLVLTGIALACGLSACISFILFITPSNNLHSMLFWLSGDLNNTRIPWLEFSILILGVMICLGLAPGLNILGRGENEARSLGLASRQYRILLYFLSSLFTATAVTLAGCIGFVGLIIPHLTRLIVGYNHKIIIPVSVLLGGSLVTLADTCARSLFAPQQIPLGILLALIGVPIFIGLLQQ